jgi:hypothetical protein
VVRKEWQDSRFEELGVRIQKTGCRRQDAEVVVTTEHEKNQ